MRTRRGRLGAGGRPRGGSHPGRPHSDEPHPHGPHPDGDRPARRPLPESGWVRGCAALLAGALPALTFPAPSLWWLACVALVPWLLLIRSAGTVRRAALDGWIGGTGFVIAVHHWLMPSPERDLQVGGARGARGADRGPVRQDAPGAVR